jgi:hypothetical protein
MNPQLGPVEPDDPSQASAGASDIGQFQQGTAGTRWILARYLVGRAIGEQLATALLIVGVLVLAVAVGVYFVAPTWLTVIIGIIGLGVLLMRVVVGAVVRRMAGVGQFGALEGRMNSLVAETRGDVRRELRRLGLPSRTATMPLLAARLLGRRRGEVISTLRGFDVDRVVPARRVDDLHMVVQALQREPGRAAPGDDPATWS